MAGDVADENSVLALFETAERALGPITALVNNAGITGPWCRTETLKHDDLVRVLQVNVVGSMMCAREAVKRMSTAQGGGGGNIVNLSSRASELARPIPGFIRGLEGRDRFFTIGLAQEVAREGIRVNAVMPGLIDTDIHEAGGGGDRLKMALPTVPMGRVGGAAEVAEAILWLLSPAASMSPAPF